MANETERPSPGTLETLVLQVLSVDPEHGRGIGRRPATASRGRFDVNRGSSYPVLERLLKKGWIKSECG